jgi:MobA/MobL family
MAPPIQPTPVILHTLRDLSLALGRATARDPSKDFTRVIPNPSKGYALGGLGIATGGTSLPPQMRYGAIMVKGPTRTTPLATTPGVHAAIAKAYENPGIRFGDRSKGTARPVSAAGTVSCHFSQTYISKTSNVISRIKKARGGRKHVGSGAREHLLYIEREGAPEKIVKQRPEEGYERDLELEAILELERQAEGRSAGDHQLYLERPGASERTLRDNLTDDELDRLEYASFGTIGNTIAEREAFWKSVDEAERAPRGDQVILKCAENPEWWANAIQQIDSAPSKVRSHLQAQAKRKRPEEISLKVPEDVAFAIHQWAVWVGEDAPIEIEPGRGGRTQTRIIAELPFELNGRERLEIIRDFTNKLAEKEFPYWAVIHAPEAKNDARNFHVHIVYYDRPCARMPHPETGKEVWDFEITKKQVYKNWTRNTIRPYMQQKARETNSKDWLPSLRAHWEKVSNAALQKAGVVKRYHLSSNASVGIELDPLKHIPSKTFNKERKGELTADGVTLAQRQWQVIQERLVRDHETRAERRRRVLSGKTEKAKKVMGSQSPYKDVALKEVERLTKLIDRIGARISISEMYQDLGRLVVDRVASRPKLIIDADRQKNLKSPGRTNSKDGQGHGQTTKAPEDKGGATQPVGRAAREAMTFLLEVYGRAVQMDRRNGAEIQVAKSQLNTLLKRLDNMMADPKRHPLDRRSPGFIDLNVVDPSPEVIAARKQERMERITGRLNAYVEAALPKILAEVAGTTSSKQEVKGENIPPVPVVTQPSGSRTGSLDREPTPTTPNASRDLIGQSTTSAAQPAAANTANAEPAQKPAPARAQEPVARPQRTRFRPEPFYKPKEKDGAPAAGQTKNPAAPPIKSPAPAPINSTPKAPAPNNPRSEAANKPVATGNSQQPSRPTANNLTKPENTTPGTKPARDNAGSTVSKPATAAPAASAPVGAQRPAAAPTNTGPAPTPAPSRPAPALSAPSVQPAAPQAGSAKESATAKVASAPVAAKAPSPAPAQVPVPRPEPARTAPGPATSTSKPDAEKAATEAKAPARPERASVAPKPSTAESGPARTPGERSGENPAAKLAKEKAEIRVGDPLSPVASKPIDPIRVEEKKPPKKPKRRGRGRDDGPGL